MDFFVRKKIFLFSLIFLGIFFLIVFTSFYFSSPGFLISSNLDLDGEEPILLINLKNDSFHVVENIAIVINDKNIVESFNLLPGDVNQFKFVILEEKINLKINSKNHLDYEKEYTLKGAISKNNLEFYPEYIFNKVNELSEISFEICNTNSEIEVVVELETDAEIKSGFLKQDIKLLVDECKILNYSLLYTTEGNKRVKFKIYNDIYSKEIVINGLVS